jgi:aubergine-like protein
MKDIRGGRNESISLIPELCRSTGYTDEMKKNFQQMRLAANHTRLNPANRVQALQRFSSRFFQAPESRESLLKFGLEFRRDLVELKGRDLGPQKIKFGDNYQYVIFIV